MTNAVLDLQGSPHYVVGRGWLNTLNNKKKIIIIIMLLVLDLENVGRLGVCLTFLELKFVQPPSVECLAILQEIALLLD